MMTFLRLNFIVLLINLTNLILFISIERLLFISIERLLFISIERFMIYKIVIHFQLQTTAQKLALLPTIQN